MVDVDQLRAVKTIAEYGSITAAARELRMSQPGLSRLVERIEDELDTSLFNRGRRGAELTGDGRKFLEFARVTLNDFEMLKASIGGHRRGNSSSAVLRVVASTTPGEYIVPRLASEFGAAHGDVQIETRITDSAGVANLLLTGEFDAGFAGQKSDFGVLRYVRIMTDEIVLAVPASHRFAGQDEIDISMLAGENLLHREYGSGTYETVDDALSARGKRLPAAGSGVSLGSTQAVVSAVDAGVGVGFVTLRAIEHHAPERVRAVRIAGAPLIRDLYLVYEPERPMSDAARLFIDFVEHLELAQATGS